MGSIFGVRHLKAKAAEARQVLLPEAPQYTEANRSVLIKDMYEVLGLPNGLPCSEVSSILQKGHFLCIPNARP
eukprot:11997874-Alexandrium_andersonii.AAC.1